MGYTTHPWNLVIFFMVNSVVAMVHSTGDPFCDGLNEPDPRHGPADCQNSERPRRCETFQVCVVMAGEHIVGGSRCRVLVQANFGWSGWRNQSWNTYEDIGTNWNSETTCYNIREFYYNTPLTKLRVFNGSPNGSWFPRLIVVKIPGVSEACYVCDWGQQCSAYGGGKGTGHLENRCWIEHGRPTEITCEQPNYGHPYC